MTTLPSGFSSYLTPQFVHLCLWTLHFPNVSSTCETYVSTNLSLPIIVMSSTCFAYLMSVIISSSGSKDAELHPKCLVVFFNLSENARGAAFVPVP
eukprot:917535-Lingulodinium_polyedra.AAC.1